jgi:pilus assembly protein CpaE
MNMSELGVVILSSDNEQRAILQMAVDNTGVARTAYTFSTYPTAANDVALKRIHDVHADVVLIDIPPDSTPAALKAIELVHADSHGSTIFAVGGTHQPQNIVAAMRSGAREYIERPANTATLLEAFVRFNSARRKARSSGGPRGKILTVVNAKGGCGATTVAVNTALALSAPGSPTALIDLAPIGHAALHLNVTPAFTLIDAMSNLHRLDASLLEGYLSRCENGLHLLAGITEPLTEELAYSDFAKLFDLMVSQYRYVVVDASSRLDHITRLVCDISDKVLLVAHADVTSLWSAAKVRQYLSEGAGCDKIRLVLNRFRKIAGFKDSDVERATQTKILWKIPNHYPLVSAAIESGIPVTQQNHSEMARSYQGLASVLTQHSESEKRKSFSLFNI